MIIVKTGVDNNKHLSIYSNKYLAIFDNTKEIKE